MSAFAELRAELQRFDRPALITGAAGLGLTLLGALLDLDQFFQSYLLAFLFWMGLAAGCMGLFMLILVTRGGWGLVMRRLLEAGARTLPLVALMFLPLLLGLERLYPWADPAEVAGDHLLEHRTEWLNPGFFILRAAFYFLAWIGATAFVRRRIRGYEAAPDTARLARLRLLGGPGVVLYVLTVTFASLDWASSLEPKWFSTMYGLLFVAGQALSALAFCLVVIGLLRRCKPFSEVLDAGLSRDLGNMLFALVMLWAYLSFSQFLIIWTGNLPEEVPWYEHRAHHGWQAVAVALILFHFAVPFFVLLSRKVKDQMRWLARVAAGVFLMRIVDYYWVIVPAFHPDGFTIRWTDITALAGLGGVWIWFFLRFYLAATPLPRERRYEKFLPARGEG